MISKILNKYSSNKFLIQNFKRFSSFHTESSFLPNNTLDTNYYFDYKNFEEIKRNIELRRLNNLSSQLNELNDESSRLNWIKKNIKVLPNKLNSKWSDLDVKKAEHFNKESFLVEKKDIPKLDHNCIKAEDAFDNFSLLLLGNKGTGLIGGPRSYLLLDDLCDLKDALIEYTLNKLTKKYNFQFITVPNLIYKDIVNACGYNLLDDRNLIYQLKGKNNVTKLKSEDNHSICLSGTSEIPLAALHFGENLNLEDLPIKYCTISRCYRKEISFLQKENGIYRVHYFDKIEMFGLTTKDKSEELLKEFLNIQRELFDELDLPYQVLDMPPHELGNSASSKYDIECWLPGRNTYGEISSTSNCTDYQSRRFNIKYKYLNLNYDTNEPFAYDYVHTVNGTACALPRMLIAIGENYQLPNYQIKIPEVLKPYLNNKEKIQFKRKFITKIKN